jgi:hypothetical protein
VESLRQSRRLAGGSQPCSTGSQCASGYCARNPAETCGTCGARLAADAKCDGTVPCDTGLVCAGTCKKPGATGAPCTDTTPCEPWLRCVSGLCSAPLADGASCDPSVPQPGCDVDHFCNLKQKVCQSLTVGGAGDACGVRDDGSYAGCRAGAVCKLQPGTTSGSCIAAGNVGDACKAGGAFLFGLGPCAYPLECVDGTCRRGDPIDCH